MSLWDIWYLFDCVSLIQMM